MSLICLFLFSCKQLTGESTDQEIIGDIDATSQEIIGGIDAIRVADQKFILSGTMDNGGNIGHLFRLRFKLPEGETLKFHFFTSQNFEGGVIYSFSRTNGRVQLNMSLNDKSHTYKLAVFNQTETIDIDLDIHNNHTDIHLLVWKRGKEDEYGFLDGCTFNDASDEEKSCLYNSEDFAFDYWVGVGRASGIFWGFQGKKSLILKLEGPLTAITNV